jgi:hypothetical protein
MIALGRKPKRTKFDVLGREQVLAGRQRAVIGAGDLGKQRKVERIARLLEPAQPERLECLGVGQRLGAIELAVGVDCKLGMGRQDRLDRLDPAHVVGERQPADLHLQHGVAGVEMAAHLVLHVLEGLSWRVPAAADIAEHLVRGLAAAVALGQQAVQRQACDLGTASHAPPRSCRSG